MSMWDLHVPCHRYSLFDLVSQYISQGAGPSVAARCRQRRKRPGLAHLSVGFRPQSESSRDAQIQRVSFHGPHEVQKRLISFRFFIHPNSVGHTRIQNTITSESRRNFHPVLQLLLSEFRDASRGQTLQMLKPHEIPVDARYDCFLVSGIA